MLEYSEYKSLMDILDKSTSSENELYNDTYNELMKKEGHVLDTVNTVVNYNREKTIKENQFLHMSLYEIYTFFFLEMPQMAKELEKATTIEEVLHILFRGHRVIYIGLILVLFSIFLFFINNSI